MITVATILLVAGGACFVVRAVKGPSLADRIVAIDGLVVSIVAAVLLHSVRTDTARFLDTGVVVALVGFLATTAGARFVERRGG
ncbi:MAG: monovalent cation/H+ antiporter complex subunit F [Acidimicrobiia bacterium]